MKILVLKDKSFKLTKFDLNQFLQQTKRLCSVVRHQYKVEIITSDNDVFDMYPRYYCKIEDQTMYIGKRKDDEKKGFGYEMSKDIEE